MFNPVSLWRRRYWRRDAAAIAAYDGQAPLTVVTGGSEGIGLAIAARFARDGHALLLIARDPKKLDAAASRLRRDGARRVEVLSIDLAAPDALIRLDTGLRVFNGYVDILVNAAGVGLAGPFHGHDPQAIDRLVDLNVRTLTALCRHVLPGMRVRGQGGILNVASLAGYIPGPQQAVYYASKAFVLSLSEALAEETSGDGVKISVVAPGATRTNFHARMGSPTGWYLAALPVGTPEAVARAATRGFAWGLRVIVPGVLNALALPVLKIVPHRAALPVLSQMLRPRTPAREPKNSERT